MADKVGFYGEPDLQEKVAAELAEALQVLDLPEGAFNRKWAEQVFGKSNRQTLRLLHKLEKRGVVQSLGGNPRHWILTPPKRS